MIHVGLYLILLGSFLFLSEAASCESLNTSSLCYPILDYDQIYVETCQDSLEFRIRSLAPSWDLLSSSCRSYVAYFTCTDVFSPCQNASAAVLPCRSLCEGLNNLTICTSEDLNVLAMLNATWLDLNCSRFSNSNCHTKNSSMKFSPPQTAKCVKYTGTYCTNIDYEIYIPPYPENETSIITQGEDFMRVFQNLGNFLSETCIASLFEYYCDRLYPRCNTTMISDTLNQSFINEPVFPQFSCASVCDKYLAVCPEIFAYAPDVTPNCLETGFVPSLQGIPTSPCGLNLTWPLDYQNTSYTFTSLPPIQGKAFALSCSTPPEFRSSFECIPPTVPVAPGVVGLIRSKLPDSKCELPCPATYVWTDVEWKQAENIMFITVPSFILSSFMLLTWIIFPSKREQHYVLSFIICVWMVSMVLVFGLVSVANKEKGNNLRNIGCQNTAEGTSMSQGGFCVFQAFTLFTFLLAATCWWFVICLDLYLRIVLRRRYTPKEEQRNYRNAHLFCWGFPLLCLLIFLVAGGRLGGPVNNLLLFCWIDTAKDVSNPWKITGVDRWLDFVTWFGPVGLMAISGLTFIVNILYQMCKVERALSSKRQATSHHHHHHHNKNRLIENSRPVIFVFCFFAVFFWFFIWRVQISFNYSSWYDSLEVWLACLIQEPEGAKVCGATPPKHLPVFIWYGYHFFLSSQGIFLTITWGAQKDTFLLWYKLIFRKEEESEGRSRKFSETKLSKQNDVLAVLDTNTLKKRHDETRVDYESFYGSRSASFDHSTTSSHPRTHYALTTSQLPSSPGIEEGIEPPELIPLSEDQSSATSSARNSVHSSPNLGPTTTPPSPLLESTTLPRVTESTADNWYLNPLASRSPDVSASGSGDSDRHGDEHGDDGHGDDGHGDEHAGDTSTEISREVSRNVLEDRAIEMVTMNDGVDVE